MSRRSLLSYVCLSFFVALLHGSLCRAQLTVVSPSAYQDSEMPGVADLELFPSYRLQQVYSASDFAHLGDGPFDITRIDWRADGAIGEPITYSSADWRISFSTVEIGPAELSSVFSDNVGADETVSVDREPATTSTNATKLSNGTATFDYGLDLSQPFTYDPAQGNLLLDLTVRDAEGPLLLDFSFAPPPNATTGFIWSGTLGPDSEVAAVSGEEQGGFWEGHAIQFTLEPSAPSLPKSPFFWDEFDRDTLDTASLPWMGGAAGEYSVDGGSVTVKPLEDDFPGIWIGHEQVADYRVRTQFRFLEEERFPTTTNPWIGIWARDPVNGTGPGDGAYWGGIGADGVLYIGVTPPGTEEADIRDQVTLFSPDEIRGRDVLYQMDSIGSEISIRAWLEGEPMPEEPQLTMTDTTYGFGVVSGLFENPSPELTGFAVRSFALLPGLEGDFNASSTLDAADIDLLSVELMIPESDRNRALDINGDAVVNDADRAFLVRSNFGTQFGDADLDGSVSFKDFLILAEGFGSEGGWAQGDFDGSGVVDFLDVLSLSENFGFTSAAPALNVPESDVSPFRLFGLMLSIYLGGRKRKKTD